MKITKTHLFNWSFGIVVLIVFFVIMASIAIKIENTASKNALKTFSIAKQFINYNEVTSKPTNSIGPWMAYYVGESDFDFEGKTHNSTNGFLASSTSIFLMPFEKPTTIIYIDAETLDSEVYDRTTTFTRHYPLSGDSKSEKVDKIILKQRKIHLWIVDTLRNKLLGHIVIFEKPLSDHYTSKKPIVSFDNKMLHEMVDNNFKDDVIYIVR